jgi:hypothetical protein
MDTPQMDQSMHKLEVDNGMNQASFNKTTLNSDFNGGKDHMTEIDRTISYDYIIQAIPIIFKVAGREILDVTLPDVSRPPPVGPSYAGVVATNTWLQSTSHTWRATSSKTKTLPSKS